MSVKINSLELENVKRIKAVRLEPSKEGLTIIGGRNGQGKTSVLDAITWALAGDNYRPSEPDREGSMVKPYLKVTLDNGVEVERAGKNSTLKVTDPSGKRAGQTLLNSFISTFALNIPSFMDSSTREKSRTLLKIIGIGETLSQYEVEEERIYNRRTEIGRIADQKKKYADEMVQWDNVPENIITAAELIKEQQEILLRNAKNKELRSHVDKIRSDLRIADEQLKLYEQQLEDLNGKIENMSKKKSTLENDLFGAEMAADGLVDESTEEIEQRIEEIDTINAKIRDNMNKARAEQEATDYHNQYDDLTEQLEAVRAKKMDLLNHAEMPLEGLSVDHGELLYKGRKWDGMSGAEQLRVATAIVRKLNPNCGFVLLDRLEQMDMQTLTEFGEWLEREGLQAIATRVSTGEECSVIIEDGYSIDPETGLKTAASAVKPADAWKEGW